MLFLEFFVVYFVVIVLVVFLIVLFFYWYGMCGFVDFKKFNVFGFKFVLFFGNFLEMRKYGVLYLMCFDYVKKYGKVFVVCLGGKLMFVVVDLEMLK